MALGRWQMQDFTFWKGVTKSNHISAVYGTNMQKATNVMIRLMEQKYGRSMEAYLNRFPTKFYEEDEDIYWKLIGSSRRNYPIYEVRDFNNNVITSGMVGAGIRPFYVVFQEDCFADGNIIVGEKNEIYQMRVLGDVRPENNLYVYKVECMGGNTDGIPFEEFEMGKRFSDEFSPVEKSFSRKVGDIKFSAPISMRNEFSRIRISHKVEGALINKKVGVGVPIRKADGGIEVKTHWMHVVDYELEERFAQDKNYCILYGRSNRSANGEYLNFGKSGNVLQTGAGIREQMEYSNTWYYNEFSLKLIEDALFELSVGIIGFKDRVFILETGERGAVQFSKAIANEVSGWKAFVLSHGNASVVNKTNSEYHSNALKAGYQFVEYLAPMGVTVKINVNPFYDDTVRNKIIHPNGGVAESYRYDIYYIGSPSEPNIQIARIKNSVDVRGYVAGLRNPFTGQIGGNMATDEDGTTIHKYTEIGALVLDPNRTLSLIPAILAA